MREKIWGSIYPGGKKLGPKCQELIDPGVYISRNLGPKILSHPHLDLPWWRAVASARCTLLPRARLILYRHAIKRALYESQWHVTLFHNGQEFEYHMSLSFGRFRRCSILSWICAGIPSTAVSQSSCDSLSLHISIYIQRKKERFVWSYLTLCMSHTLLIFILIEWAGKMHGVIRLSSLQLLLWTLRKSGTRQRGIQ